MCGRFTLTVSAAVLADLFDLGEPPGHVPRFNIAPTQTVPVVRVDSSCHREWLMARWGLIPHWAKDSSVGSRLINARSETASAKPSFRSAIKVRRCLVPADGFFEWKKTPTGKQPFHIRFRDRQTFAFAGLWESWKAPDGGLVHSFTILTTAPNDVAKQVHQRMPCILAPKTWQEWLSLSPLQDGRLTELTAPYPATGMEAVAVNRRVNSPANDDSTCINPVPTEE